MGKEITTKNELTEAIENGCVCDLEIHGLDILCDDTKYCRCTFRNCDFSGQIIDFSDFKTCNFIECDLEYTDILVSVEEYQSIPNLIGSFYEGCKMKGCKFKIWESQSSPHVLKDEEEYQDQIDHIKLLGATYQAKEGK